MKTRKLPNTQYTIKECYAGKQTLTEIVADIILSEHGGNSRNTWTREKKNDIIQNTDNSQISCLFKRESVRKE